MRANKLLFLLVYFLFGSNSFSQEAGKHSFTTVKYCEFHSGKNSSTLISDYRYSTFDSIALRKFILQVQTDSLFRDKTRTYSYKLLHMNYSPLSIHLLFIQLLNKREIHGAEVKVNLSKKFEFLSEIHHNLIIPPTLPFSESDFKRLKSDFSSLKNKYHNSNVKIKETYTLNDQYMEPVLEVKTHSIQIGTSFKYLVGSNNRILCSRDLDLYFSSNFSDTDIFSSDSIVKAYVFYPDPLTSAGASYGGAFMDNDDKDTFDLTLQRKKVDIRVNYNNGVFSLKNNFVWIDEFDLPSKPVLTSDTCYFNYTRSEDGFEQVNAFYFINLAKDYIFSLGFDSLCNQQVRVDVSGNGGADKSRYSATGNFISYGEGEIDDAEDADVILHEYFHAITHSAAPGSVNGFERITLEEANADYFAASFSKSINPFGWEKVFNWDGNTPTWQGRSVKSTKHYPEDFISSSDVYVNGDIWSSTLMQIWNDLGREKTDRLLFQSMYSYSTNMNFTQAARLFLQADSLLYQKTDYLIIGRHFYNRGIFSDSSLFTSGIYTQNLPGFIERIYLDQSRRTIYVHLSQPCDKTIVEIRDIEGRMICSRHFFHISQFDLSLKTIKTGMYFISIYTDKGIFTKKCIFY